MPQIMLHQDEVSPAYDYRSYVEATFVIVIPHLITSAIGKQETPNRQWLAEHKHPLHNCSAQQLLDSW